VLDEAMIETPTSSNVAGFSYRPSRRELEVQFKNGSTYFYQDVPQSVADEMVSIHKSGQSVGTFIAKRIKGQFELRKA